MEFILQTDDFLLEFIPHLNDVAWEESILEIMVKSGEFSAATEMEIEDGDFQYFHTNYAKYMRI